MVTPSKATLRPRTLRAEYREKRQSRENWLTSPPSGAVAAAAPLIYNQLRVVGPADGPGSPGVFSGRVLSGLRSTA